MVRLTVCIEMFWPELSYAQRIAQVAAAGLPAFEFWNYSDKDLPAIRAAAQANNLQVAAFVSEPGFALTGPTAVQMHVDGVRRAAEVGRQLDASTLIVTAGNIIPGESYEITHVTNGNLAFGDSVTVTFNQDQMLRIWEFYVDPGHTGPVSITVDADPANGPLHALWLDANFQINGLAFPSQAAASDAKGRAWLDLVIPNQGYNALLVYRDPDWIDSNPQIDVTIEIDSTPPDFIALTRPGWYAPVVPRAAFDGTPTSVPAPALLPGNVHSTYFNAALMNNSSGASQHAVDAGISVDGELAAWIGWGPFAAGTVTSYNWDVPWTVRGGRHTVVWKTDYSNANEEIYEDNNAYGEQWVWSPLELVNNAPVQRQAPPEPYAGWLDLSFGAEFYPNSDGVRMPGGPGYWHAVAAMPTTAASDVDLLLHEPSDDAKGGFAGRLAGSFWGGDYSDHVLVNFNVVPNNATPFDVGVLRSWGSTDNYVTESTATSSWLSFPDGTYGPFALAGGRILNLLEMYLPAGQLGIHLLNVSGAVDWGLTLHRSDLAYQGKSDALGQSSWYGGPGGNELLVVDVPAAGYYCLAVWKRGSPDLWLDGEYNLLIRPMWASGVGDPVPSSKLTELVDVTPNPFNPQTKITFDLAHEGPVRLEVYDVQGRLVRTLVDGARGVGRHVETWNGLADDGGRAASGAYLARLTADGTTGMLKMMLLK